MAVAFARVFCESLMFGCQCQKSKFKRKFESCDHQSNEFANIRFSRKFFHLQVTLVVGVGRQAGGRAGFLSMMTSQINSHESSGTVRSSA